jgi:murein DD-endopeptidase MepM/ murein hydrolase activator NlpD
MLAGRGVVVVTHAGGLRSTFEPVDGALPVGAMVAAGARVGRLAMTPTHCEPAVCLHWGVLRGRTYLDPLALLGRRPIVLLPLA